MHHRSKLDRAMSSDGDGQGQQRRAARRDAAVWEDLPWDVQARILCLLCVSDLLRLLAVSRSFLALIRSPSFQALREEAAGSDDDDQIIFLFIDSKESSWNPRRHAMCYQPSTSRFFFLPFPRTCSNLHTISFPSARPSASSGLVFSYASSSLVRLLSRSPPRPVTPVPPHDFFIVGLLPASQHGHFLLLAISRRFYPLASMLYDSRDQKWTPAGALDCNLDYALYARPGPCIGDRVFLLALQPHRVVAFHAGTREWEMLPAIMPAALMPRSALLFSWDDGDGAGLFLVGGACAPEVNPYIISGIIVWKMDWEAREWRQFRAMPEDTFQDFIKIPQGAKSCSVGCTYGEGIVCFFQWSDIRNIALLQLSTMEWRKIPDCDLIPRESKFFYGLVATPATDLLNMSTSSSPQISQEERVAWACCRLHQAPQSQYCPH